MAESAGRDDQPDAVTVHGSICSAKCIVDLDGGLADWTASMWRLRPRREQGGAIFRWGVYRVKVTGRHARRLSMIKFVVGPTR